MEIKDILDIIGFEGDPTPETLQKHMDTIFVPRVSILEAKEVGDEIGRITGSIKTKLSRQFKDLEIEIDGKSPEEIVANAVNAIKGKLEAAKNVKKPELVAQYEKDLLELKTKYSTTEEINKNLTKTLEEKEAEIGNIKAGYELNYATDKVWNGFAWADGTKDITKEGFQSRINKKYDLKISEGNIEVYNKEGKPIFDSKGHKKLSLPEILEIEGKAEGVLKVAGSGGGAASTVKVEGAAGRVHPNALKAVV